MKTDLTLEGGFPASVEAERTILGTILLDNVLFNEAAEKLSANDFCLDSHRRIFSRMTELVDEGRSVDVITLAEALDRKKELQAIGDRDYLWSLTEQLPRRLSIEEYVRIVKDKSQLRSLMTICNTAIARAADQSGDAESVIGWAETELLSIRAGATTEGTLVASAVVPLLDRMHAEKFRSGELLGLSSGVAELDLMTRGFQDGEITIVGSRSGVGKTSLMIQTAIANCTADVPVILFSLEMTREQILRRIFSRIASVPYPRVRDTQWANDSDMQAIRTAAAKVATWPLHVVDTSGLTIERLTAQARLAIRQKGVKLVAVDYVQIVNAQGRDERLRVAAISRSLTRLAKDEKTPVVVLSQLARPDKSSANRRPVLSDFRESSQLENDAHVAVLLHRPWDEDENRLATQGELIVAKQRSGETGIFPVTFDKRTLVFEGRKADQRQKRDIA